MAAIRAGQIATQLQIVGRIGKDQIDTAGRQAVHHFDAVTHQDAIGLQLGRAGLAGQAGIHQQPFGITMIR